MWILLPTLLLTHGGHHQAKSFSQLNLEPQTSTATVYVDLDQLVHVSDRSRVEEQARAILDGFVLRRGDRRCESVLAGADVVGVPPSLRVQAAFECPSDEPTELEVRFARSLGAKHLHVVNVSDAERPTETVELAEPFRWSRGRPSWLRRLRVYFGLGVRGVFSIPPVAALGIFLVMIGGARAIFLQVGFGVLLGVALRALALGTELPVEAATSTLPLLTVVALWLYRPMLADRAAVLLSPVFGMSAGAALVLNGLPIDGAVIPLLAALVGTAAAWAALHFVTGVVHATALIPHVEPVHGLGAATLLLLLVLACAWPSALALSALVLLAVAVRLRPSFPQAALTRVALVTLMVGTLVAGLLR